MTSEHPLHNLENEFKGVERLCFSTPLEERFRRHLRNETIRQARIGITCGAVIFLFFGFLDRSVFPDHITRQMWFLRYIVITPPVLILVAAAWTELGKRNFFPLLLSVIALISIGIVGFMTIITDYDPQLYYGGLMLTTIVAYIFFGLRLPKAAAAGLIILAIYIPGDIIFINSDRMYFINNVTGLLATNILGMVAAYLLERQHRKTFLQSGIIEQKNRKLEKTNIRLTEMSYEDSLTEIANRRRFDESLAEEWARASRHRYPIALLILDIDHFKAYNDTFGHQAGDSCLHNVASVLPTFTKRPGDLAARYGGEEFVVLLPGTSVEDGKDLAEQIHARIISLGIEHPVSEDGILTVSIGVASAVPTDTLSRDSLVAAADEALYRAKDQGRNKVCY